MSEHTTRSIRLDTGELVTATFGAPDQYATHAEAARAAATITGAEVIQRGRPFYVRLPLAGGPKFCTAMCGVCPDCQAALHAVLALDDIYESLSDEDAQSLHQVDEDDPRSFALDHKGRP
jgi:hypothetical protein